MTRWDLLRDVLKPRDVREAIGKAWPLFLFLIFNTDKSNKYQTTYAELAEKMNESANTLRHWKETLEEHKVIQVFKGKYCMTIVLLTPYDSLATCEQDDVNAIKIKADPATKRLLDQMSSYNNVSLLPIIAEITAKLESLEKKLG